MSQYITCPDCGANLDPGEKCDCKEETQNECVDDKTGSGGHNG